MLDRRCSVVVRPTFPHPHPPRPLLVVVLPLFVQVVLGNLITSVHRFGLTSFYPLNKLKFRAESNYDTAHARRRKEMVDIFCVMLF